MKNRQYLAVIILAIVVLIGGQGFAQNRIGDWQSFTNMLSIRGIAADSVDVYAATNGGLLIFHPDSKTFEEITGIDGLSHTNLNDITIDKNGRYWLASGFPNGDVNVWDPQNGIYDVISLEVSGSTISTNKLVSYQNRVFGTATQDIKSVVIEYQQLDNGEYDFKDFYDQFPAGIGSINDIVVYDNRIYLATDGGLVRSALLSENPNLKTSESWELLNFTGVGNKLTTLTQFNNRIYFSTGENLWLYDSNGLQSVDVSVRTDSIYTLSVGNGSLYLGSGLGVFTEDTEGNWKQVGSERFSATALTVNANNDLWAGTTEYGIAKFNPDSAKWNLYKPNGPLNNQFASMVVDNEGRLIAINRNGIAIRDGETWINLFNKRTSSFAVRQFLLDGNRDPKFWIAVPDSYRSAYAYSAVVDNQNNLFVSHEGAGVLRMNLTDYTDYEVYDTTESHLSGSQGIGDGAPNYIVTRGIALDRNQNLWIANAFAANGNAIAVRTQDGHWYHFNAFDSNYPNPLNLLPRQIAVDNQNRIWISSQLQGENPNSPGGIMVLDYGADLANKGDDQWYYIKQSNNLSGMDILSLEINTNNRLYIVSNGENRVQSFRIPAALQNQNDLQIQTELSDQFLKNFGVNSAYADNRGNMWFTTSDNGVKLMQSNGVILQVDGRYGYTTDNSELMSNTVLTVTSDPNTGVTYFATDLGISALTTEFAQPINDFSDIYTFPSPYYIPNDVNMVISQLPDEVEVKILSLTGNVIRTLTPNEGEVKNRQAFWDGKDESGELVGSGVYFIYCYTQEGKTETTKALVVRK